MRLMAELEGETHDLKIEREGRHVKASIDGRCYQLEAREIGPGAYLLTVGKRIYQCRLERGAQGRELLNVEVRGRDFQISLADPKRLGGSQSAGTHADGTAQIVAPMPGKVVRVLVQNGHEVKAGEGVLVVEAMKMQNEMKSPRDGTVTDIKVADGETVDAGQVLAVIE